MKALKDYSFVRGMHCGYAGKTTERWHRDLELGKRVGLNSTRIWLSYESYKQSPDTYFDEIKQYFHVCAEHGFTVYLFAWDTVRRSSPRRRNPNIWANTIPPQNWARSGRWT